MVHLQVLPVKAGRQGQAAPWRVQAPVRSLFHAAILARRSALDSRLLRSFPRPPPSLPASLQHSQLLLLAHSCWHTHIKTSMTDTALHRKCGYETPRLGTACAAMMQSMHPVDEASVLGLDPGNFRGTVKSLDSLRLYSAEWSVLTCPWACRYARGCASGCGCPPSSYSARRDPSVGPCGADKSFEQIPSAACLALVPLQMASTTTLTTSITSIRASQPETP